MFSLDKMIIHGDQAKKEAKIKVPRRNIRALSKVPRSNLIYNLNPTPDTITRNTLAAPPKTTKASPVAAHVVPEPISTQTPWHMYESSCESKISKVSEVESLKNAPPMRKLPLSS